MGGTSRSSRWREARIADGGKAVGVTLTAGAARALETLQAELSLTQRQAISLALEYAGTRLSDLAGREVSDGAGGGDHESRRHGPLGRVAALESRLARVEETLFGPLDRPQAPSFHLSPEPSESDRGLSAESDPRGPDPQGHSALLWFTARQMREHGERVSRGRLFEQARHENLPIQDSLAEYSTFVSLNMDRIRELMKSGK